MSAPVPTEYPVTLTTAAKMREEMNRRGYLDPQQAENARFKAWEEGFLAARREGRPTNPYQFHEVPK